MEPSDFLFDGPQDASITLVLAHGAGAPMNSTFMNVVARGVAGDGIRVARFEFPYMRERRPGGPRRAPDPGPVLKQSWLAAIARLGGAERLVIGGKSLGGRIASMVADEASRRAFRETEKRPSPRCCRPRRSTGPAMSSIDQRRCKCSSSARVRIPLAENGVFAMYETTMSRRSASRESGMSSVVGADVCCSIA